MEKTPPGQEPASERIVQAVADYTDTDPLDMPCLFHAIDPDGFDVIVEGLEDGQVHFQYAGCDVTARGDGSVDVIRTSFTDDQQDVAGDNGREYVQD